LKYFVLPKQAILDVFAKNIYILCRRFVKFLKNKKNRSFLAIFSNFEINVRLDDLSSEIFEVSGILDLKVSGFQGLYTVDIFSGEPGESAQLRFALKNFGRISSDLGEFRPLLSRRIC
jgi:hypothetical protein